MLCFRWGHMVTQLVEALCCKPEGHGFDSRWGHWIFFDLPNPSSRTMAVGFTKPLTEMSTRNIPGGVKSSQCIRPTTSPPFMSRLSRKREILNVSEPCRPPRTFTGIALCFYFVSDEWSLICSYIYFICVLWGYRSVTFFHWCIGRIVIT
jgi:hypothetical protein